MLVGFLLVMFCGITTWLVFSIVAYTFIYGSLILAYAFVWDEQTRKAICPHGLWATLIHNE